jgi:para-aminobenzoate synthetase component 2
MIVVVDNYDSFTYNLVQYLGELGEELNVFRNDEVSVEDVKKIHPKAIIISPGPCTPKEAGISIDVIRAFSGETPILGVCLGHQSIAMAFEGNVIRAREVVHGKIAQIYHDQKGLYRNIENPFTATRYHSLIVEKETLPDCFEISAQTVNGVIMGIRHKQYSIEGVQFHPESILTDVGKDLLKNFLSNSHS